MFPFRDRPFERNANGRYPWTGWRTADTVCAVLSLASVPWLIGSHPVWAALSGVSAILCAGSAWGAWSDRLMDWGTGIARAKVLQKLLGGP